MLLKLWKEGSGPCMQVLHFAFAFGAFIGPLIAKPFISEEEDSNNTTNQTGSGWGQEYGQNQTDSLSGSQFGWAYWITSWLFLPTMIAYAFYAVKYDFARCLRKKPQSTSQPDESDSSGAGEEEAETKETDEAAELVLLNDDASDSGIELSTTSADVEKQTSAGAKKETLSFRLVVISLLCLFIFLYVGLEVAYGNWIFTVVVTGVLNFSKSRGTIIQSLFWGAFAFTRKLSILLAFLNIKASVMMTGNLTGSLIATFIMISFPHNATAIWIASAVLGMSYASIYPTTITWMCETIEVTGTATSFLVTAGILGDITIPSAVGALVAQIATDSLFYITFVGVVISASIIALLFTITYLYRRKQQSSGYFKPTHEQTNGREASLDPEESNLVDHIDSDV